MRTLVDLLHDDRGYVRIFADHVGFGYEKAAYTPDVIGDLFDRMVGYDSIANARDAAQLQLQILGKTRRRLGSKARARSRSSR